ncbi:MAG: tRNA (adenosine(37)-N6)-threonylcarbamoyltransferase complex ATPase subunit type 1 TsaE [Bacteroidetes bacterium]|nr:tRNA (adenosine(37)-N6)-threonylcarbamoyltransferase complex ATPase subunit type 1 TsaE [Bacteroidota bacterium]
MILEIENESFLKEAAEKLVSNFGKGIYAFKAEMGVGKTTFIRYILEYLGIDDFEGSPTYTIIHRYDGDDPIYHIDCYRIEKEIEGFEIGLTELFNHSAYFFIEWPEKIDFFLPTNVIWVYIRKEELTEKRIIHVTYDNQS